MKLMAANQRGEHIIIIISSCPETIIYYIKLTRTMERGKLVINAFMELPSDVAFHV